MPEAVRWPSPAALQRANRTLELEVAERKRAEAEVRRINAGTVIRLVFPALPAVDALPAASNVSASAAG